MFEKGQTVYMKDGTAVEFNHVHDGVAYVHPILTTITQSTSYRGDDFDEYENEAPAAHLIPADPAKLFTHKPLAALDDEIVAKRAELADIENLIRNANSDLRKQTLQVQTTLTAAKAELDRWRKDHAIFVDLGRMLDGAPMFPLQVTKNPYHKSSDIPHIPKWSDVSLLTIHHNHLKKDNPWSIQSKHNSDSYYQVQFFYSEEERKAVVERQFISTCEAFRRKPKYSTEGKTYSTGLDFGTLTLWTMRHPHLEIPEDIVAAKQAHDAGIKEAEKEELRKRLEAMEADL